VKAVCRDRLPELLIVSQQRSVRYDEARLGLLVREAMPSCVTIAETLGGPLSRLDHIECTVLGTRAMARVHREFLDIRGPTDVITFPYGEILVCAPVAASRAGEFGHDVTTELALYCIHGLLHLAGHDDLTPREAGNMARIQEKLLRSAQKAIRSSF